MSRHAQRERIAAIERVGAFSTQWNLAYWYIDNPVLAHVVGGRDLHHETWPRRPRRIELGRPLQYAHAPLQRHGISANAVGAVGDPLYAGMTVQKRCNGDAIDATPVLVAQLAHLVESQNST